MKSRQLDDLLRRAGTSAPQGDSFPDITAGTLRRLQSGENPWVKDWHRLLFCWVPVGLVVIVLLALAVASLPHGDHERAVAPPLLPDEER